MSAKLSDVDPHALAELRSLAYHREIARRIARDHALVDRARDRVREWLDTLRPVPGYARAWDAVLGRPLTELLRFLEEDSERARELRQSTPFAGIVPPRERWRIWRDVRERGHA